MKSFVITVIKDDMGLAHQSLNVQGMYVEQTNNCHEQDVTRKKKNSNKRLTITDTSNYFN